MMSGDKPFACKVPGCNQKFVNEDHLEVHRKKHDANLGIINLKSLDTPVIADQTPTPTRFLKTLAGDDGLFTDLHSADLPSNPFDAEFQKASKHYGSSESSIDTAVSSEAGPNEITTTTMTAVDMTQPLIQERHLAEEIEVDGKRVKMEDVILSTSHVQTEHPASSTSGNMTVDQHGATTIVVMSQSDTTDSVATQIQNLTSQLAPLAGMTLNGPIMIKLPTGQTIPVLPPSVTNPQAPIPTAVSANPGKEQEGARALAPAKVAPNNAVKQKLKTTLLSNQSQGNMNVMAQAVDVVTRQQEVSPVMMDDSYYDDDSSYSLKRSHSSEDDDPDNKRQRFLERNRAAAMRCRNKRKQYITDLERRADDLTSSNGTLNNEVTRLRNEVAQLKELLLAHKDCPITVQQREAGLFGRVGELPGKAQDASVVFMKSTSSS